MWIPVIDDRTLFDVIFASENRNDDAHHKGAQNYTDWNRVSINMHHVADILSAHGHAIALESDPQRTETSPPLSVRDVNAFRTDIQRLRTELYPAFGLTWGAWSNRGLSWSGIDVLGLSAGDYFADQEIPQLPYNHWEKINEIERIIGMLPGSIETATSSYRVCGTFCAGQSTYLTRYIAPVDNDMTALEFNLTGRTWREIEAENRSAELFFKRND